VENLMATGVCLPTWEKTLALQMSVMSCVTWDKKEVNMGAHCKLIGKTEEKTKMMTAKGRRVIVRIMDERKGTL
jgi:hypothetical protein